MPVDIKIRKVPFSPQIEQNINEVANSNELQEYQLVSSFMPPVVGGEAWVILIFQKRSE